MPTLTNAGPTPNPIPNSGIIVDSQGRLTEQGWWYLESLRTGTISALQASTLSSVDLVPVGGVATPDVSLSGPQGSFQISASATPVTVAAATFTNGTVPAGATLTFYYDQDATGGRSALTWAAGWPPELNTLVIVEEALTRTVYVLGYDGATWTLKGFGTGLST